MTFDWYVDSGDVPKTPRIKDLWYLDDTVPTLQNVRGKIVLLRRFALDDASVVTRIKGNRIRNAKGTKGINVTAWQDNSPSFGIPKGSGRIFKIQDAYQVGLIRVVTVLPVERNCINLDDKKNKITNLLDIARNDSTDTWFINFTSGSTCLNPDNVSALRRLVTQSRHS